MVVSAANGFGSFRQRIVLQINLTSAPVVESMGDLRREHDDGKRSYADYHIDRWTTRRGDDEDVVRFVNSLLFGVVPYSAWNIDWNQSDI